MQLFEGFSGAHLEKDLEMATKGGKTPEELDVIGGV